MVSSAVLFAAADAHGGREGSPQGSRPFSPGLALLPVGNKPLVVHALDELLSAGVKHVAVVSEEALAEDVQAFVQDRVADGRATNHVIDAATGLVDALRDVAPAIDGDEFIVHLCDSLRHDGLAPALDGAQLGSKDVLALVDPPDQDATPLGPGLAGVRAAGVYVFGREVLELPHDHDGLLGRWDSQIAAAAERLEQSGGHLELRTVEDSWRYCERPDILLQANRFFLSGLNPAPIQASLESTDLQGRVSIDPSARLRRSTVRGPVIIGPEVEVSDAYIGPYSSIGRGVVIENAEVEHSIVLPGASIRNLGGRLEASVVGRGAHIFRDFRLPRAFRLNVGEGAEVAIS